MKTKMVFGKVKTIGDVPRIATVGKICACGQPAVKVKGNSGVCARCLEI